MTVIDPSAPSRPGSVTIIQWLGYLQGALSIVAGILFLSLRNNDELTRHYSSTEVTIAAIVAIAIGLATWWVAAAYARGSRLALVLIAFVTALNLGSSVAYLFLHPGHVIAGLINIAISLIIFYLAVLSPDTRDYFDRVR